ncbi:MAG: ribonuclease HI family protein [Candidatus Hodarchaeota archaeon]
MNEKKNIQLFTDGGARGNPGPAAMGVLIIDWEGKPLKEHKEYLGEKTNNQAEYLALIKGMAMAAVYWKGELHCFSDSELMVKQLNGEYQVKNPGLRKLYTKVKSIEKSFTKVVYTHLNRTDSSISTVDRLVNEALDEHLA